MKLIQIKKAVHADLAGFCLCLAISLLAYVAVARPPMQARAAAAARAAGLAEQATKERDMEQSVASLRSAVRATEEATETAPVRLQTVAEMNRRLAQLATLAADCGLEIQNLKPAATAPSPGTKFYTVSIDVSGTGGYRTCGAAFVHRLHRACPDMAVTTLDLSATGAAPAAGNAMFRLAITWYVKPAAVGSDAKK